MHRFARYSTALLFLWGTVAHAGWFSSLLGSDNPVLMSMGKTELKAKEVQADLDLLEPAQRDQLLGDQDKLEAFLKQELVRDFVLVQARNAQWQLRHDVEMQMDEGAEQALYAAYILDKAKLPDAYPSVEKMKAAYQEHPEAFMVSGEAHLRQIFLKQDKGEASKQWRADELATEARQDAGSFADLAREHSEQEDSAAKGGDLGWVAVSSIRPEIQKALNGAKIGDVVGPVQSTDGWHVLKVEGIKPAAVRPFEEVQGVLRLQMRNTRQQQLQREYLRTLTESYPLKIDAAQVRPALSVYRKEHKDGGTVVGRMGDVNITLADLGPALTGLDDFQFQTMIGSDQKIRQFVATITIRRFVTRLARKEGVDKWGTVSTRIKRARDEALYQDFLRYKAAPAADYPPERVISAVYDQNRDKFRLPPRLHIAQIFRAFPQKDTKELPSTPPDEVAQLVVKARSDAGDFAALAKDYSQHIESADKGGDLGWVSLDTVLPAMRNALRDAKPGAVVGPIRSSEGWHILKVLERKPAATRPLAEVRGSLTEVLRRQKTVENAKAYLADLTKKNEISVNKSGLEKLANP